MTETPPIVDDELVKRLRTHLDENIRLFSRTAVVQQERLLLA
jgi:hypothetical protein